MYAKSFSYTCGIYEYQNDFKLLNYSGGVMIGCM